MKTVQVQDWKTSDKLTKTNANKLKNAKYITMGVSSMSELPFVVVTSGAENEHSHAKLWVGILLTMERFFYLFMGIVIVDSFEALLL